MAHPLKVGKSVRSGPGILLERPDLAAQIGSICADWASLEDGLASFYAHLMGIYLPSIPGFEPPTHPVAFQIFDEVQTIHSRVQLVKKLAEWAIKDEDLKKRAVDILDKVKKSGKGRNKIAHAVWGICDEESDALILLPNFGSQMIYKLNDFKEIAEQIYVSKAELGKVHHEFYKSRK
ncbi:hypothetical protein J2T60_000525 [Natronospira proteinivora]|uniref:Uncharacterized protein n=1 Tax=Natronospira proteinivora TaxID=1807133 RepID=A0ABT1G5J1_9GAMM|nr:hypothetical protein [Natronospira proteinivora]MCP1726560.1 hypothetical protein [Natronospira proteinivora]